MKSISVFGGGISGLTIAHELSEKGFNVIVYEKDDFIGGMAKSKRNIDNIPTEHSWRGYNTSFYTNCIDILKRIPIQKECFENLYTIEDVKKHNKENDLWTYYKGDVYDITEFVKKHPGGKIILKAGGMDLEKVWDKFNVKWHKNSSRVGSFLKKYKIGKIKENFENNEKLSVFNNLTKDRFKFIYLKTNGQLSEPTNYEYLKLLLIILQNVCSDNRKNDVYQKTLVKEYMEKHFTEDTIKYILNGSIGPGIGLDLNTSSLYQFCFVAYLQNMDKWKVMNKPTSEAWFDYWKMHLEKNNVKFVKGELKKINTSKNEIINCELVDGRIVQSNEYCCAVNPYNAMKIFEESNIEKYATQFQNLMTINNQISFFITFKKKIKFPSNMNANVLIDSLYNITMYSQDNIWCKKYLQDDIKSLWSGTCCQSQNGITLSIADFKNEIVKQIFECKYFIDVLEKINGFRLTVNDIDKIELYDEWKYVNGRLESDNKKWVNNVFNEDFKPSSKTDLINMYIAGGHTKTTFPIWSMESSVESGKIVSNLILQKYDIETTFHYKHDFNIFIKILSVLDNLFYLLKLPNVILVLFFLVIVIIVIFIIQVILKYNKLKMNKM